MVPAPLKPGNSKLKNVKFWKLTNFIDSFKQAEFLTTKL